jgi:hypothetical protein
VKTFECACGARIFFENTQCLACSRELGFALRERTMLALEAPAEKGSATRLGTFRKCSNYVNAGVCNWLVPVDDDHELCEACRLNNVVPNLDVAENRDRWAEMERAKRRLVYTLAALGLPIIPKSDDADRGLAFDIKAETPGNRVLTGHEEGLITLNLSEADTPTRERIRADMKERYRTLLGHFRHEVGHYFWERLIHDRDAQPAFRELFGDETRDYGESLAAHYARQSSAPRDDAFISAYASSHPWEDWAETFAHYLHLVDTLETAQTYGLAAKLAERPSAAKLDDFDALLDAWNELAVALNALNRSMGLPDAYPFAISPRVRDKLAFVHRTIRDAGRPASAVPSMSMA